MITAPLAEAIFSILSNPRVASHVIKTNNTIPINPRVSVEFIPKRCQLCVVSFPKINPEIGIQIVENWVTNVITHAAYQTNAPIKAGFSPIETSSHE